MGSIRPIDGSNYVVAQTDVSLPVASGITYISRGCVLKEVSDGSGGLCFSVAQAGDTSDPDDLYISLQEFDSRSPGHIIAVPVSAVTEFETDYFEGLDNADIGTALVVGEDGRLVPDSGTASSVGTKIGYLSAAPAYRKVGGASVRLIKFKSYGCTIPGAGSMDIVDPAVRYAYYYWCKNIKGETVDPSAMSYSMSTERYIEFMT